MERRGAIMESMLIIMAMVMMMGVVASSSLRNTFMVDHHEEEYRRILLSNGLGLTPPMGFVFFSIYLQYASLLGYSNTST